MRKLILFLFCVSLFVLFSMPGMAQQLSGESAPFVFDTQGVPAVPVSPWVVIIVMLLAVAMVVYRFVKQKKNVTA